MKKVLFLLMMVMMLGSCQKNSNITETPTNTTPVISSNEDVDNNSSKEKLDLSEIKVGDKIDGMTVTLIAPFSEHRLERSIPDFPMGEDNVTIEFSGEVTLEGTYEYNSKDVGFIGGDVCFSPKDENTLIWWFCFSNQEFARQEFAPEGSKGKAKIVIDNYNLNSYPAEVMSTASLVKVLSKDGLPYTLESEHIVNIGDNTYRDETYGIEFTLPEGWILREKDASPDLLRYAGLCSPEYLKESPTCEIGLGIDGLYTVKQVPDDITDIEKAVGPINTGDSEIFAVTELVDAPDSMGGTALLAKIPALNGDLYSYYSLKNPGILIRFSFDFWAIPTMNNDQRKEFMDDFISKIKALSN